MKRPCRMSGNQESLSDPTAYGGRARAINAWFTAVVLSWIVALAAPASADAGARLLAFGDSLVAGYGLPQGEGFTAQLQRALRTDGYDVTVTNAGVSGDTTAGGRARIAWSLAEKPDAAIVVLGGNDGLRGLDPEDSYRNLAAILETLQGAAVPTLLAGMYAPPNLGRDYGAEFRAVYERLDREFDVVFYEFFLDGVAAEPALNQGDGIHPNADGVAVIVERMVPALRALMARAGVPNS